MDSTSFAYFLWLRFGPVRNLLAQPVPLPSFYNMDPPSDNSGLTVIIVDQMFFHHVE